MKKILYVLMFLPIILASGCEAEENPPIHHSSHETYQIRQYIDFFHLTMFSNGRDDSDGFRIATLFESDFFLRLNNPDIGFKLVYDIEEANRYVDEYTTTIWPNVYTDRVIFSLNHFITEEVDVGEFNLTYPITRRDVIDSWESVDNLRMSLERVIRNEILYLAFYIDHLLSEVGEELIKQIEYATFWEFRFLFGDALFGSPASITTPDIIRSYAWHIEEHGADNSEVVFVYSRGEAEALSDEVFVAYSEDAFRLENRLESLNAHIRIEGIDLELFSLMYPITEIDLVDNWGNVNELMNSLEDDVLARIRRGR